MADGQEKSGAEPLVNEMDVTAEGAVARVVDQAGQVVAGDAVLQDPAIQEALRRWEARQVPADGGEGEAGGQLDPTPTPRADVPEPGVKRKPKVRICELWEYDDGSIGFEKLNTNKKYTNALYLERIFEIEAMKIRQHITIQAARETAESVARGMLHKALQKGGKVQLVGTVPPELLKQGAGG